MRKNQFAVQHTKAHTSPPAMSTPQQKNGRPNPLQKIDPMEKGLLLSNLSISLCEETSSDSEYNNSEITLDATIRSLPDISTARNEEQLSVFQRKIHQLTEELDSAHIEIESLTMENMKLKKDNDELVKKNDFLTKIALTPTAKSLKPPQKNKKAKSSQKALDATITNITNINSKETESGEERKTEKSKRTTLNETTKKSYSES